MMSCGLGVRIFFWWGLVNVIVGQVGFKLFSSHVFKQFWRSKLYKAVTFRERPKNLKQITRAIASHLM